MASLEYENEFRRKGYSKILGIDEAGRGPLAGPLVVAGVILPEDFYNDEINDSKQLSDKKRRELYQVIMDNAIEVKVNIVDVETIDRLNILRATKEGMEEIVKLVGNNCDAVFVDAVKLDGVDKPVLSLIKGDALSVSIAAASIIAKVTRDDIMLELDKEYPMYDFKKNKGYGTKNHLLALDRYGVTKHHRMSYAPVYKASMPRFDI
jgi:ribonuclease HII